MTKPQVDILLTYWGEFRLLKKAVESVFAQTYQDWHLLVVDDCYPSDEAQKYFRQLKDARVKYVRHKKNIGITNNFNYVVHEASAKYCVMLGCDDKMLPNYLETAIGTIGDADFYQPGVQVIDQNDTAYLPLVDRVKSILRPKRSGHYSGEKLAASLCRGNWLYFPSILWKTSVLKRYPFDAKYKIVEDVVVELDLICDGGTLHLDPTVTFQYRRFAESVSSKEKTGVRFDEEDNAYNLFAEKFARIGWKKASRAARQRFISRAHRLLS
jgi:glycosyltransferase involved in cell wall biosynthesis